ncbi:MAG: DUF5996 family protein [Balneolaceae bacterium]
MKALPSWPELPTPDEWKETLDNLHMWTQIVGKIRLLYMPWINHSWHTTFYLSATGLTTSLIPQTYGGFEISFNFIDHRLNIKTVGGENRTIDLQPMTVAEFYHDLKVKLNELDISAEIYEKPVELPDPIVPFPQNNKHAAYDKEAVYRFWRALIDVHKVFTKFRAGFQGKASPVHFFWGAFDLAVTFFSGRKAPRHPGGIPNCPDRVMEEAYSRELSSAGFWPGGGNVAEPAFYAYAYPEPDGYRTAASLPEGAFYHESLGEYLFPYRIVRNSENPDETLLSFLKATYEAASIHGDWDKVLHGEKESHAR